MANHENCADALVIASLPFGITVDTTANTDSPSSPDTDCGSGNSYNSYWLKYTVLAGETILDLNISDPNNESVVTAFIGSCGSLVPITGTNCTANGTPVTIDVVENQVIFFMITSQDPGGDAAIAFTLAHPEPSGDFCAYLSCGNTPIVGSGLYYIERGKRNDSVYTGYDPVTSEDVEIPNPFWETYLIGDE